MSAFCVQVEEGWWNGYLSGKSGLFPSNFVKELDATGEEAEPNDTAADENGKEKSCKQEGPQQEDCSSDRKTMERCFYHII